MCPSQLNPSDSAFVVTHTVKFSLGPRVDSNPLKLTFPHPVRDEDIWISSQPRNVFSVALKKAVQDPWPCEIQGGKTKWDSENMKIWENVPHGSNSLRSHLDSQFELYHLQCPRSLLRKNPLNNIRVIIREMFENPQLIFLKIENSPTDILRIVIHQPVVTSPTGSPMLFLSVHDLKRQKFLASKGKLDESYHDSIYNGIYTHIMENSNRRYMFTAAMPEVIFLWRYIFRVNSTKILQKNPVTSHEDNISLCANIPLGANSPWLTSLICPYYLDCPFKKISLKEFKAKNPNFEDEWQELKKGYCAGCNTISENLKRCSRGAYFCSVECQKAHWDQHKDECDVKPVKLKL